jgi:hypothetical protein
MNCWSKRGPAGAPADPLAAEWADALRGATVLAFMEASWGDQFAGFALRDM